MPKPVPVTVTKVPPMLPPVFGLTETKEVGKVKLVISVSSYVGFPSAK